MVYYPYVNRQQQIPACYVDDNYNLYLTESSELADRYFSSESSDAINKVYDYIDEYLSRYKQKRLVQK